MNLIGSLKHTELKKKIKRAKKTFEQTATSAVAYDNYQQLSKALIVASTFELPLNSPFAEQIDLT
ncbi:MAG: hypothetical protein DRH24_17850 [Deltaproteobacteria bacterium]|nr:MAG: hypothetical protein DRH24_17850 [Deltaproteobacteria bacterium]